MLLCTLVGIHFLIHGCDSVLNPFFQRLIQWHGGDSSIDAVSNLTAFVDSLKLARLYGKGAVTSQKGGVELVVCRLTVILVCGTNARIASACRVI